MQITDQSMDSLANLAKVVHATPRTETVEILSFDGNPGAVFRHDADAHEPFVLAVGDHGFDAAVQIALFLENTDLDLGFRPYDDEPGAVLRTFDMRPIQAGLARARAIRSGW